MKENWLEHFITSDEILHFELEAAKVYSDLLKKIADNDAFESFHDRRNALFSELETRFDSTTDLFVKSVVSYSLVTGIYFISEGLSTKSNMEKYKGKRFTEFRIAASNASIKLAEKLVSKKKQYLLASNLVSIAVNSANKKNLIDIENKLIELVYSISFDEDVKKNVESFQFITLLINYLLNNKNYVTKELLKLIDTMIDFSVLQGDTAPTKRSEYNSMGFDCIFPEAFNLKIKWYQKKNDKYEVREVAKKYAKTYEQLADERSIAGGVNLEASIFHLEKAINIYRKYELTNSNEMKQSKIKLDKVKEMNSKISNPNSFTRDVNLMDFLSEEENSQLNRYIEEYKILELNQKIMFLINYVPFFKREEILKIRKESKKINKFYEAFPVTMTNEFGQTIFESNSEETKESLALFKSIKISGASIWMHLLQVLFDEKVQVNFSEIIEKHPILKDKVHYVNKGFELFFEGDIYSSLYLLLPQVEWWFREVARQSGEQTSNLKNFPVEQSKTLIPIFETESLKSYLGEDRHWLFKQLMTEEPMNVRNKVAHGLEFNDNGYCAYFVLCVIKLLFEKVEKDDL